MRASPQNAACIIFVNPLNRSVTRGGGQRNARTTAEDEVTKGDDWVRDMSWCSLWKVDSGFIGTGLSRRDPVGVLLKSCEDDS